MADCSESRRERTLIRKTRWALAAAAAAAETSPSLVSFISLDVIPPSPVLYLLLRRILIALAGGN